MRGESGMLAAIDMTSELSGSLGLRLRLTLQGEQKYRGKPQGPPIAWLASSSEPMGFEEGQVRALVGGSRNNDPRGAAEHSAHGALYRAVAASVQGLLALRTSRRERVRPRAFPTQAYTRRPNRRSLGSQLPAASRLAGVTFLKQLEELPK